MAYENMQFKPEEKGADFSLFLQGDLMKEAGLENDKQGQLEWVLKNRIKFRELIESHPELKQMYIEDHDSAVEFTRKLMDEKRGDWDESLNEELAN